MIHVNPRRCRPSFPIRVNYLDVGRTEEFSSIGELCEDTEQLDTMDPDFADVSVETSAGRPVRLVLYTGEVLLFQLDPGDSVSVVRYLSRASLEDEILVEYFRGDALRACAWRAIESRRLAGHVGMKRERVVYPIAWDSEHEVGKSEDYTEEPSKPDEFDQLWWSNRRRGTRHHQ